MHTDIHYSAARLKNNLRERQQGNGQVKTIASATLEP